MITIIKEGKKEFIGRCSKCGCEFKYELSDILIGSIYCPCCSNYVYHPDQSGQDISESSNFNGKLYNAVLGTNVYFLNGEPYLTKEEYLEAIRNYESLNTWSTSTAYNISTKTEPISDSECFIAFETIKQKDMIKLDCPAIIKIDHYTYYFDPKEKTVVNGHLGMLLHEIDCDMMKGLLNQDETTIKLVNSNPSILIFDDDAYLKHSLRNSMIQVHKFQ